MTAAADNFGARILHLADRLAAWSDTPEGLTCLYLTDAHRAVAAQLRDWMTAAGMQVTIDSVGNVTGRYASRDPAARTLILASHYDTVRNAGKYDGRLGILTPLVVIEHLNRAGRRMPFHVDLVCFSEEEGVRFPTTFIGSKPLVGKFDPALLDITDKAGIRLSDAIRQAGHDPAGIPSLKRRTEDLLGYVEIHIEQGPVLLNGNAPVGIVTSIAGHVRRLMTITGTAGHAGTVPMAMRHDAGAAAAEIVLAVERRCGGVPTPDHDDFGSGRPKITNVIDSNSLEHDVVRKPLHTFRHHALVGTCGIMSVPDAAINVIPGSCELSLDIRAVDDSTRDAALADIDQEIARIAERRGVRVSTREVARSPAVPCSARLRALLSEVITAANLPPVSLPSGAGHDAMMFHGLTELAMLFVRCGNGGISHSPLETVTAGDAGTAAQILLGFLLKLESL